MLEPADPPDESLRIQDLCGLHVLDTPQEERFDRITRSAIRMFNVPIALISLVDTNRQWFKSRQGLEAEQTPRNISFCGHAILAETALVVEDASADARFADNPLVLGDLNLRFYAGHPLRGPAGFRIGTLCLIDKVKRNFSADDIKALADLAAWAETELSSLTLAEATKLAQSNQERLRQSQKLLQAVMSGTSAYVHLRDLEGRFLYVNPEYERVFKFRQEDILGKTLADILPAEQAKKYQQDEADMLAAGATVHTEAVLMQEDGPHTYLVVRSPLHDEAGRIYGACGVGTDITEDTKLAATMHRLNQQLSATTNLHQAILNGCNFSIISTDVNGIIRTFNAGAEKMLGYRADEMVGQCTPAILHVDEEVIARAHALSVELGYTVTPGMDSFTAKAILGYPDEHEWTYVRKDGTTFPIMLSATALFNEDGQTTGFLGIAYDLTERKRIENMKNEFISTVSHELRTPLTSIRGSIGLLAAGAVGEIPARAKSLLDIAKSNCERLVRLINDILDIEKIESGNMRFTSSVQLLRPMLEMAMNSMQAYANQYHVKFSLEMPEEDIHLNVDADRLIQVIVNLISNAVKFSPQHGVVKIRVTNEEELVRVSVADKGEGIAKEFQQCIFKKFAQADSSDTRAKGGTGLGLNISKAIIERMHGKIGFHSEVGKGSEFYFELPKVMLASAHAMRKDKVLICEDDADIAKLLSIMLAQGGIATDIAPSAEIARRMLFEHRYEALTLDLSLPGESGISFMAWLRKQPSLQDLPIVVVSAHAEENAFNFQGRAFGVLDWISKPIDQVRLLQVMQKLANKQRLPRILHVEDDPDVRSVVATMLQDSFDIAQAGDLSAAQKFLSTEKFALILLDLDLPDGNAASLLAELPHPNRATPAVIFSAQEASEDVAAKVKAALVKAHTSNEQLLSTLRNLIGRRPQDNSAEMLKEKI